MRSGFKWRGGLERMTTGMWLWSRPFVRRLPEAAGGGEVAVLLMDTQGLFDSETGQMLTTCIFGLSALMSSYLIFNVNRQVQEDHLQHLALFTEYGRRVREQQEASTARAAERRAQGAAGIAARSERRARGGAHASSCTSGGGGSDGEGGDASDQDEDSDDGGISATDAVAALRQLAAGGDAAGLLPLPPSHAAAARTRPAAVGPPFQCLEFLVRDAVLKTPGDAAAVERAMAEHLSGVLGKTHNRDLKSVRDHIRACFEDVSAFALPHPGFAVAENEQYMGTVSEIRPEFTRLIAHYARRVFAVRLHAKMVGGRAVGAAELGRLFKAYTRAFQERSGFPEAKLLLDATAEANNASARDTAARAFDGAMDAFFRGGYASNTALGARHARARTAALRLFDSLANFGADGAIADTRAALEAHMAARRRELLARNAERDPTRVIGPLLLALGVALAAWVAKQLVDLTCAPWLDVCRRGSQMFAFVYSAILIALGALAYYHRKALSVYRGALAPLGDTLTTSLAAALRAALGASLLPSADASAPPPRPPAQGQGQGQAPRQRAPPAPKDDGIDEDGRGAQGGREADGGEVGGAEGDGGRAASEEEARLARPTVEGLAAAAGVRRRRSARA